MVDAQHHRSLSDLGKPQFIRRRSLTLLAGAVPGRDCETVPDRPTPPFEVAPVVKTSTYLDVKGYAPLPTAEYSLEDLVRGDRDANE